MPESVQKIATLQNFTAGFFPTFFSQFHLSLQRNLPPFPSTLYYNTHVYLELDIFY